MYVNYLIKIHLEQVEIRTRDEVWVKDTAS